MSGIFNNLFGGKKEPAPIGADQGFDDFNVKPIFTAASASAASVASSASSVLPPLPSGTIAAANGMANNTKPIVYTKWYRVWERTTPADFIIEAVFVPAILLVCIFHMLGMRRNRARARTFAQAHLPLLQDEFSLVGYGRTKRTQPAHLSAEDINAGKIPSNVLKERGANEFTMYASGRQNVAFLDINIVTSKWYNPFVQILNLVFSFLMESVEMPVEKALLVSYAFDGHEADLVPAPPPEQEEIERKAKKESSVYDGFVFAVVHKNAMRKLRFSQVASLGNCHVGIR
ncbi:hypothetical protein AAP_01440 [Ascosphaera apis ARSEF 7405]|uniref:Uncharacterized protein n=1 Tax=Ascosphaera apis ARSEF 7405 TaxID=392613 RepID=A0A168BUH0_9EURO|nr:hypothetical protein AAP_01440 [Ascosphaera apis ARSEF 7405]